MISKQTIGLIGIIALFVILTGYQIRSGMLRCEGNLVYPLDDPYIHLMLAKNVANNGTWGFNPGEFASSSSSLLYTLILSLLAFLFGSSELTPLLVNFVSGILLLVVLHHVLRLLKISQTVVHLILVGVVLLVPLLSMVVSGMEHTLQLVINAIYFYMLLEYLSSDEYRWDSKFYWLCVVSALTVMIRFEGLFFLPLPIIYLLFSRQFGKAVVLGVSGILPVLVFGLISVWQGAYFLPNSLIIKGQRPDHFDLAGLIEYAFVWLTNLYYTKHLLGPFVLFFVTFIYLNVKRRQLKSKVYIATAASLLYFIAHLQLAKIGWFYRYESYLLVFAFITYALVYKELVSDMPRVYHWSFLIVILGLSTPLYIRGYQAFADTPKGMKNVYEQQYQMAEFIHKYYRTDPIGANDVGAITFLNEIRLVDLYGLGSTEVLKMKVKGEHTKENLEELVDRENVKIVIIYDGWFDERVPESWTKVCEWYIKDNVVCTFDFVSFFASDPTEIDRLRANIREFAEADLPPGVEVVYK